MLVSEKFPEVDALRQTLRDNYRRNEDAVVRELLPLADMSATGRARAWSRARKLVVGIREAQVGKGGVDALLNEFALSTEEGIVLMCLAEALLRVPDKLTTDRLIRDKLSSGDWSSHLGNSESIFVNASAWGLLLTGKVVSYNDEDKQSRQQQQVGLLKRTVNRVGEPVIRSAVRYAMQIMGTQFVMGKTIAGAIERAQKEEARGYRYSYDMLGEGARTSAAAERYFQGYISAIASIGAVAGGRGPADSPGISIKLSAIHPRYEVSHRERVMRELVPRLKTLALAAKEHDIGFTVDAEEADRLDLSLDVIGKVFSDPDLGAWEGFGLAIQSYLKSGVYTVDWAVQQARAAGRKMMVRLVKGAYWDSEIKWSQEEGYAEYPVFTRKAATDLAYQACVKKLLESRDAVYPQFATHNAYAVAAILELDEANADMRRQGYEFQRLHGMGDALYDQILKEEQVPCRIYAPVGEHADLLAYLVRRLLENGANTSFVSNIVDENVPVESLLEDPVEIVSGWRQIRNAAIPLPEDLYLGAVSESGQRKNSAGLDLSDINELKKMRARMDAWWLAQQATAANAPAGAVPVKNPARREEIVGHVSYADVQAIEQKLGTVHAVFDSWSSQPVSVRAALLRALSDALETNSAELIALCIKEAGKTVADGVAEVREAVDFCRYYADRGEEFMGPGLVKSRGVILCISPWNFPLAIFLGQVSAALVMGNTVLAKPAEQTSLVALRVAELMGDCGFPPGVMELLLGPGKPIGEQVVPDLRVQGVMFTGSTETGRWLSQALAERPDAAIPLIAETGGQNAMIVDSTALPEQVVDDVVRSGFQSAGQRCSALRVLFLQQDVADRIIEMIIGAMRELSIGDPAMLSTDVGPVIDEPALQRLQAHDVYLAEQGDRASLLHACEVPAECVGGNYYAPRLYEVADLSVLQREVFGPVVHIIRFQAYELDRVIDQINATGYGLTLGVHSRIQALSGRVAQRARAGNIYINRNMIGAIVGVQPFGGRGLSGTGPKAGGPQYVTRLIKPAVDIEAAVKEPEVPLEVLGEERPDANTIAMAELAQLGWAAAFPHEKESVIRRFLSSLVTVPPSPGVGDIEQFLQRGNRVISEAESRLFQPELLPGPTGESNHLYYESRGVLAILLGGNSALDEGLLQIIAALLAGNAVLVLVDSAHSAAAEDWARDWLEAGLPPNLLTVLPFAVAKVVLSDTRLQGVLLPPGSGLEKTVQRLLAQREGALVPLISDCIETGLLMRLILEKTVTVDTTAAGGNTSLMTMTGD
jgi:RHH-type proline utilization regulon transcriptional repressor/proline dehydrogenase/delta 1-pyrroline-5-carboxylate dehydrogenase